MGGGLASPVPHGAVEGLSSAAFPPPAGALGSAQFEAGAGPGAAGPTAPAGGDTGRSPGCRAPGTARRRGSRAALRRHTLRPGTALPTGDPATT